MSVGVPVADVLIHLLLLPLFGGMAWRVWQGPVLRRLVEAALGTVLFGVGVIASAVVTLDVGPVFFGLLQSLAWLLFVYAPLLLVVGAIAAKGRTRCYFRAPGGATAL